MVFYQVKYEEDKKIGKEDGGENETGEKKVENLLGEVDDSGDDSDFEKESERSSKGETTTMIFRITNTLGLSFIDNQPREFLQISFKNLEFAYSLSNEKQEKLQHKNILDEFENHNNFATTFNHFSPNSGMQ